MGQHALVMADLPLKCVFKWKLSLVCAFGLHVSSNLDYDPEQFVDQEVPMLIVGTKKVS